MEELSSTDAVLCVGAYRHCKGRVLGSAEIREFCAELTSCGYGEIEIANAVSVLHMGYNDCKGITAGVLRALHGNSMVPIHCRVSLGNVGFHRAECYVIFDADNERFQGFYNRGDSSFTFIITMSETREYTECTVYRNSEQVTDYPDNLQSYIEESEQLFMDVYESDDRRMEHELRK